MSVVLDVAVAQLQSNDDLAANLERTRRAIRTAAGLGAQLVLLPENFAFFGPEARRAELAETLGSSGPIQELLSGEAARAGVSLIAGGMPEKSSDAGRPYNTGVVIGPDGSLRGAYRKVHLFDVELPDGQVLRESETTMPGQQLVVVDIAGVSVGLTICYDLRFGSVFAALVKSGAQLIVVPAAFTAQTGAAHWNTLIRARAIEFQCWIAAAGQWGRHPGGRATYGHSQIVDPWGRVAVQHDEGEGVVMQRVALDVVEEVRSRIPVQMHQRLEVTVGS